MKYIIISILLSSCISTKESNVQKQNSILEPQIIFLNYKIYRNLDKENDIKLISKIKSSGELKKNSQPFYYSKNDAILCFQIDNKNHKIDSIAISNPLNREIEFFNQNGEMNRKEIKLDSASFSIRMQLNPKTKQIHIYQNSKQLNTYK